MVRENPRTTQGRVQESGPGTFRRFGRHVAHQAFGTLQTFDVCHTLCELRQFFAGGGNGWPTAAQEAQSTVPLYS